MNLIIGGVGISIPLISYQLTFPSANIISQINSKALCNFSINSAQVYLRSNVMSFFFFTISSSISSSSSTSSYAVALHGSASVIVLLAWEILACAIYLIISTAPSSPAYLSISIMSTKCWRSYPESMSPSIGPILIWPSF